MCRSVPVRSPTSHWRGGSSLPPVPLPASPARDALPAESAPETRRCNVSPPTAPVWLRRLPACLCRDLGEFFGGCEGIRCRAKHHANGWAGLARADRRRRNSAGGGTGDATVSEMRQRHGSAHRQAGRQCGTGLLGVRPLSGVPGCVEHLRPGRAVPPAPTFSIRLLEN